MNIFAERIEPFVEKRPDGCWIWKRSKTPQGYGQFRYGGTTKTVHRVVGILFLGLEPSDSKTCVCHTCDVRACVNPAHLFLGSHKENSMDAVSKDRIRRGTRHHAGDRLDGKAPEIFRRFNAGEKAADLAKEFGVAISTMSALLHKRTHKRDSIGLEKLIRTGPRPVVCITDGKEFPTVAAAGRHYGIREGSIWRVTRGERKSVHGLKFELKDRLP